MVTAGIVVLVDDTVAELRRQAKNAAMRNKPTMWAYYNDIVEGLTDWFDGIVRAENDYAFTLAAISHSAITKCPNLADSHDAARLWAMGVYARRILRAAGYRTPRTSLAWLRERVAA